MKNPFLTAGMLAVRRAAEALVRSECVDCAGTGTVLVTRTFADPMCGGYEEEFEELCSTCEGYGD
jgi:DnaJ-class molecular chaperone